MADSTLLPEPDGKCWADGLRWEREETLEADCICARRESGTIILFSGS